MWAGHAPTKDTGWSFVMCVPRLLPSFAMAASSFSVPPGTPSVQNANVRQQKLTFHELLHQLVRHGPLVRTQDLRETRLHCTVATDQRNVRSHGPLLLRRGFARMQAAPAVSGPCFSRQNMPGRGSLRSLHVVSPMLRRSIFLPLATCAAQIFRNFHGVNASGWERVK